MRKSLIILNKIIITFVFIIICFFSLKAQEIKTNSELIEKQNFHQHKFDKHRVSFLFSDNKSAVVKYNPVTLSMGGLMYFYQKFISVQFSSSCLYNPTCSHFSKLLILEYGVFKGTFLSADRLTRCNRLAASTIYKSKFDEHDHKIHEEVEIYRMK